MSSFTNALMARSISVRKDTGYSGYILWCLLALGQERSEHDCTRSTKLSVAKVSIDHACLYGDRLRSMLATTNGELGQVFAEGETWMMQDAQCAVKLKLIGTMNGTHHFGRLAPISCALLASIVRSERSKASFPACAQASSLALAFSMAVS